MGLSIPLRSSLVRHCAVFSMVLSLCACEEVIDSPFELVESKLVISSTFAPNKPVTVRLSATQPVTGELQVTEVNDAKVALFKGTNFLQELVYIPGVDNRPGIYQTVGFVPEVNHHYTMHASARGFTPVSADSKIPTSIEISGIQVKNLSRMSRMELEVYDFLLEVDYDDPTDASNYYDLRLSQEVIPFRVTGIGDTTFYDSVFKSVQSSGQAVINAPSVGGQASVLIKDKPNSTGVTIQLQSVVRPKQEILGSIVAELRTVSEPYFLFQRNIQGEGDVFSGILEPRVNSYTNVTAGYGVFAGYSSNVRTVAINNR